MKPTVLMMDVDGVVVRHPDPSGWSVRIEDLGIPRQALQDRFFKPWWDEVVHGRATLRDRLAPALADVAPHVSCDQLIRYWFEGDAHLDEALLLQLAEVRASGVPLHLATVQEHERASYHGTRSSFAIGLTTSTMPRSLAFRSRHRISMRRSSNAWACPRRRSPSSTTPKRTSKPHVRAGGMLRFGPPAQRSTRSFQN
nr:hypothetical protein [Brevundimonas diminuta]